MARYIDVDRVIEQVNSLEQLARKRVYDTPTNSPIYERYSTQFSEMEKMLAILKAQPTADVVPKSELEQLQRKYDLAVAEREANVKGFAEELEKVKTDKEKYFSPQEVRNMTPKEIHENYTAIQRSMVKWN